MNQMLLLVFFQNYIMEGYLQVIRKSKQDKFAFIWSKRYVRLDSSNFLRFFKTEDLSGNDQQCDFSVTFKELFKAFVEFKKGIISIHNKLTNEKFLLVTYIKSSNCIIFHPIIKYYKGAMTKKNFIICFMSNRRIRPRLEPKFGSML